VISGVGAKISFAIFAITARTAAAVVRAGGAIRLCVPRASLVGARIDQMIGHTLPRRVT
jgi:hypothetical protein